jgi:hypothetical protein
MWIKPALVFFVLMGCSSPQDTVFPDDVIRPDKMVAVMVDVHLIEGARTGQKIMGDTLKLEEYYAGVLKKHQLTDEEYQRSFDFYSSRPAEFEAVFDKVIEVLAKKEAEIAKKNRPPEPDRP